MARSTMANRIAELRQMTNTGVDDYSIGATYYWSDDQLEDVLDRHQLFYNHVLLAPEIQHNSAGAFYKVYRTGVDKWEGGTVSPAAYLQDATGGTVAAAGYAFDDNSGVFVFTADQGNTPYYITGYAYDMNRAAAEVWRVKAAHASVAYDVTTDNHGLKRSQLVTQALQMAQMYDGMAGLGIIEVTRSDATY